MRFLRPKAFKKLLQSNLHTQKSFTNRSIDVFLMNVGVFLFRKNHNRNPPEPTKNLAEQTEKPIKTHCKPCKNRLTEKRSKIKTVTEIL